MTLKNSLFSGFSRNKTKVCKNQAKLWKTQAKFWKKLKQNLRKTQKPPTPVELICQKSVQKKPCCSTSRSITYSERHHSRIFEIRIKLLAVGFWADYLLVSTSLSRASLVQASPVSSKCFSYFTDKKAPKNKLKIDLANLGFKRKTQIRGRLFFSNPYGLV